jgi:GNAT superfamily N-acetyltransferase
VDGAAALPGTAHDPVTCRPCVRGEIHAALRLILGTGGRLADEAAVLDFLEFSLQRRIDLNDIWVAERDGRVVWAMLPIVSPGRTMLLLTPNGSGKTDLAGKLADAVCEHFAARGVRLAQVLLDPADAGALDLYLARSFRQMAELQYLQVELTRPLPAPPLPDGIDWLNYSWEIHASFADTIVQSYRDSLDCPGLNGLRDIEDVMTGHKASGVEFDPSLWFLLREHSQPVGVLLLAPTAAHETFELVYLGLVPNARRRGLADLVMREALHAVSSRGPGVLALAVDAHNAPALRLYHRHGMRRVGTKLALMRQLSVLSSSAPLTTPNVSTTRPRVR